ncbi:MAG: hypothetical protein ACXVBW_11990 [Bdellovibrionota bacterium]
MSDTISAKKTESLFVAGMILDIVPAAMRVIRAELRRSARAELTIPQLRVLSNIYREVSTAGRIACTLSGVTPYSETNRLRNALESVMNELPVR